jgi:hypothetical protein
MSRASCPVFIFCAPVLIFGDNEGVGSSFHILRSRTHFRRYRGRQLLFSCFTLPDSFSTITRASTPIFMFCAPGLIYDGNEGVDFRFDVLSNQSRFPRYRRRHDSFSCFALPDSFSAGLRATCPVFDGSEIVGSSSHVLRSRT